LVSDDESSRFIEDDLHNHIIGHLDKIEEGLALVEYKPKVGENFIDLECVDKHGNRVYIELEWAAANAVSIGQVQRYREVLEGKRTSGEIPQYRLMFYVPEIGLGEEERLHKMGIETIRYDKAGMVRSLKNALDCRVVLGKVKKLVQTHIRVTGQGGPTLVPLIDACYASHTLREVRSGRAPFKGLRQPTIGLVLEMTLHMCDSRYYFTNPCELIELIHWNLSSPFLFKFRGGSERVSTIAQFASGELRATKQLTETLADVAKLVQDHSCALPRQTNLLHEIASDLVRPKGRKVYVKDAFALVMSRFKFVSAHSDRGVSYANNMGLRILELMLLMGMGYANPGPGSANLLIYDSSRRVVKKIIPQSIEFTLDAKRYRDITQIL
jgi:hypothetical protein